MKEEILSNDSYPDMQWNEFNEIVKQLNFEETLFANMYKLPNMETRVFVLQKQGLILHAIIKDGLLSRATLYGELGFDGELNSKQKEALKGSGYIQVSKGKLFIGFSVTRGARKIITKLISEFEIIPKWTDYDKVCIGFVDNTYENGCGRSNGFTRNELRRNHLISKIMF